MDRKFFEWLVREKKRGEGRAQFETMYGSTFRLLTAKSFNVSDVQWTDDRHATAHGF